MGIVYQGYDERHQRDVAIKVLHPHLLKHENLKERFRREARVHGKIRHPNIVRLFDLFEDGEHMALVMEMVQGRNLRQYLAEQPSLSLEHVLEIADKILVGLQASHEVGVVHRDIKPGNVLLTEEGEVKLMDFGLAKPQSGEDDLTKSGVTVGSFRYMSPEQILNQHVDVRSDLYSFGILLYEMCTGRLPFDASGEGAGEFEIMEKQVREMPVDPRKLNRSLPRSLADLILSLLSKDPAARPASCEEVRDRLRSIRKEAEGRFISPLQRNVPPKPGRKKTAETKRRAPPPKTVGPMRIWMGFLILLALLGLGAYFWLHRPIAVLDGGSRETARIDQSETIAARVEQLREERKTTAGRPLEPAAASVTAPVKAPKHEKKLVPASVTFSESHRVIRFDGSSADMDQKHEFRGGARVFFLDLEEYPWKGKLRSYKQGWTRLAFHLPVEVDRIVIHKASVGDRDFHGGHIKVRVVNSHGQSRLILDRQDRDIDRPLSIKLPRQWRHDLKVVEVRFRSPEPLTIGPIDLLP